VLSAVRFTEGAFAVTVTVASPVSVSVVLRNAEAVPVTRAVFEPVPTEYLHVKVPVEELKFVALTPDCPQEGSLYEMVYAGKPTGTLRADGTKENVVSPSSPLEGLALRITSNTNEPPVTVTFLATDTDAVPCAMVILPPRVLKGGSLGDEYRHWNVRSLGPEYEPDTSVPPVHRGFE